VAVQEQRILVVKQSCHWPCFDYSEKFSWKLGRRHCGAQPSCPHTPTSKGAFIDQRKGGCLVDNTEAAESLSAWNFLFSLKTKGKISAGCGVQQLLIQATHGLCDKSGLSAKPSLSFSLFWAPSLCAFTNTTTEVPYNKEEMKHLLTYCQDKKRGMWPILTV